MDATTRIDLKAIGRTERETARDHKRAVRVRDKAARGAVRRGYSMTDVAEALGVSRATVARAVGKRR